MYKTFIIFIIQVVHKAVLIFIGLLTLSIICVKVKNCKYSAMMILMYITGARDLSLLDPIFIVVTKVCYSNHIRPEFTKLTTITVVADDD